MAVRELDGVDDVITLGGDGAALSAWGSLAVVRFLSTTGIRAIIGPGTGSNDFGTLYIANATALQFGSNTGDANAAFTLNTTDWFLVGFSKAAGALPRFHLANLTTGAAASHVAGTNAGGGTSDVAGNWTATKIGSFLSGGSFGNFRIGAGAILDVAYSDADFDGVKSAKTTASIAALASAGDRVWDFNQASTATAVVDLLTGSSDQSAITGTTVVTTDDPPGWTFGLGGGSQALAGTSAGTSTSTGDLTVAHTLAATSASTSTTTGALSLTLPLAGTSAGTSTTTGAITSLVPVAGTSAGTSTSSGALTVAHTLAGTSAGTSTSTGDLIVTHSLAGTSAGTSTTTGDLTLAGQQALAGTSAGTSTTTGALTVAHTLTGASAGTSTSTGDVSVAHPLAGTSAGTSSSTGTLSNLVPVAGTSAGASTSTGALVITRGLAGTSAGTSATTGAMRATFALEGLSAAVSTSSGALRLSYALAGLSTGTSVTTGDLTRTGLIEDVGWLEGDSTASNVEGSTGAANQVEAASSVLALIE